MNTEINILCLLVKKNKIPEGTSYKINKLNLCSERVDALVNGRDLTMKDTKQPIKIKPNFCNMNLNKEKTELDQSVSVKKLSTRNWNFTIRASLYGRLQL